MKHLLLLHGALGHSEQFTPYTDALSKHFHIHTPLFSGHGNIALPEAGITIDQYVQELATYCDQQDIKEPYIFGHSMGGYVALCYALQQPEKVHSIMTLGTKFDWTEEQALKESKMLDPQTILAKIPKYAAQLEAQHGAPWEQLLPAIAALMVSLGKQPLLHEANLARLNIPVQVMIGDKDNMVSLEESAAIYRSIPHGRFSVLPDTKHPMDRVRPQLLLELMKDFWSLS